MNLVYPLCTLGGILIGVPVTVLLSAVYDRRKNNVVELPQKPASNVTPIHAYRNNVRTLPSKRGASA